MLRSLARVSRLRPYRPRLEPLEDRSLLSACTVDRLSDNNPAGGGGGTALAADLRYCIANAGDGDDIAFRDGITGTINLRGALPILPHRISIHGPGAGLMTVRRDTGGNYSIFIVPSATVSI